MNLIELRELVIRACDHAHECRDDPEEITVSIQLDDKALWSSDVELTYDVDGCASGCVIHGVTSEYAKEQQNTVDTEKPVHLQFWWTPDRYCMYQVR